MSEWARCVYVCVYVCGWVGGCTNVFVSACHERELNVDILSSTSSQLYVNDILSRKMIAFGNKHKFVNPKKQCRYLCPAIAGITGELSLVWWQYGLSNLSGWRVVELACVCGCQW